MAIRDKDNVGMLDFIKAHETSDSIQQVSQKTGLTEASVQARASKYRNPEYKMSPKLNDEGKIIYRREGGGETTDNSQARVNSQGKLIRVMVRELDKNNQPIVKRQAIPLKTFPKGGSTRLQVEEALELLRELRGETSSVEDETSVEAEA